MLLEKLAALATHLDSKGYHNEAEQVDALMRFVIAGMQCACDCENCKQEGEHKCECKACADDNEMCACI